LRYFGILRTLEWYLRNEVSEQVIGPIFMVKQFKENASPLNMEPTGFPET